MLEAGRIFLILFTSVYLHRADVLDKYDELSNKLEGLLHCVEIRLICYFLQQRIEKEREIRDK